MCRIVEQHGLVAGVEQGSEGASVGALIVRIIRVRFLSPFPTTKFVLFSAQYLSLLLMAAQCFIREEIKCHSLSFF